MEKDWLKRPSDGQQQEARKKTLIRLLLLRRRQPVSCTLVTTRVPGSQAAVPPSCSTLTGAELSQAKEVCVPVHLAPPGSPQSKQLCHLHAQLSLGQSCHRQKIFACTRAGSLRSCPTLCDPVDCGLSGFSVRRGSPGKNTEAYWPILVAISFSSTIFPAALAANTPEYLVLSEPLRPKQLHHLHTWPLQGQTQVLQGSLRSKLQWMTHIQRWKENHNLNPRAVWLRKKTPNLPTSSTS